MLQGRWIKRKKGKNRNSPNLLSDSCRNPGLADHHVDVRQLLRGLVEDDHAHDFPGLTTKSGKAGKQGRATTTPGSFGQAQQTTNTKKQQSTTDARSTNQATEEMAKDASHAKKAVPTTKPSARLQKKSSAAKASCHRAGPPKGLLQQDQNFP